MSIRSKMTGKVPATLVACAILFGSALTKAQEAPAADPTQGVVGMDELLDLVREGFQLERVENKKREERFRQAKADQTKLLEDVERKLDAAEARSQALEVTFNEGEGEIAEAQERLGERMGQMGELFGVVRQVSTDFSGQVWDSLISSQLGERKTLLDRLGRSTELPTTHDLESLWFELQREMVEQGKVVRYTTSVLTVDGEREPTEVLRVGPFNAVADGRYLLWETENQQLRELTRQPPGKFVNTISPFESRRDGIAPLAVDPSRGSLLNALTDTPSFEERINQGGVVGYVIIVLGLIAVVVGLIRWAVIAVISQKVAGQAKSPQADSGNPLGRILRVYEDNKQVDVETLELRLDEVVLKETARLARFIWLVKVVSVVAPLLGLLGTVTGMIQTFQAITLFGAGDPKMMAGGISEALVTTMLGLATAIPLVLLHAALMNSTRRITETLDEQSAGLIATRAEESQAHG